MPLCFKARLSGECVLMGLFCHTILLPLKAVAFLFGRMNKLERFHNSVLQELSNLEENLQGLKGLEEDALASSLFVLSLGRKRTFSGGKRNTECLVKNLYSISGVLGETVG